MLQADLQSFLHFHHIFHHKAEHFSARHPQHHGRLGCFPCYGGLWNLWRPGAGGLQSLLRSLEKTCGQNLSDVFRYFLGNTNHTSPLPVIRGIRNVTIPMEMMETLNVEFCLFPESLLKGCDSNEAMWRTHDDT